MIDSEYQAAERYSKKFASFISGLSESVPTAHQVHKSPQQLPYAVWYEAEEKKIHADGKIIYRSGTIKIELYARVKDILTEQTIDEIFQKHHFNYSEKEQHFVAAEQCKCIIYSMSIKKEGCFND